MATKVASSIKKTALKTKKASASKSTKSVRSVVAASANAMPEILDAGAEEAARARAAKNFAAKLAAKKAPAKKMRAKEKKGTLPDEVTIREAMMSPAPATSNDLCSISPRDLIFRLAEKKQRRKNAKARNDAHAVRRAALRAKYTKTFLVAREAWNQDDGEFVWKSKKIRQPKRPVELVGRASVHEILKAYGQLESQLRARHAQYLLDRTMWIRELGWWEGKGKNTFHTTSVGQGRGGKKNVALARADQKREAIRRNDVRNAKDSGYRPAAKRPVRMDDVAFSALDRQAKQFATKPVRAHAVNSAFAKALAPDSPLRLPLMVTMSGNGHGPKDSVPCMVCGAPKAPAGPRWQWKVEVHDDLKAFVADIKNSGRTCQTCGPSFFGLGRVDLADQPAALKELVESKKTGHMLSCEPATRPTNGHPPCPIPGCKLVLMKVNPFKSQVPGMIEANGVAVCGQHLKELSQITRANVTAEKRAELVNALLNSRHAEGEKDDDFDRLIDRVEPMDMLDHFEPVMA